MTNFADPLEIPEEFMKAVYRQAREAFPAECCGWLSGPAGRYLGNRNAPRGQRPGIGQSFPPRRTGRPSRAYVFSTADLLELEQQPGYRDPGADHLPFSSQRPGVPFRNGPARWPPAPGWGTARPIRCSNWWWVSTASGWWKRRCSTGTTAPVGSSRWPGSKGAEI